MWKGSAESMLSQNIVQMDQHVRKAFSAVKEEMEEHLQAINESTDEIQANYEYLLELEEKLEKLSIKVDELQMMMKQMLLEQIEITRLDDGKSMKLSTFIY
ncbi:hypothetical protein HYS48_00040 [Candidatus Woesearchaeota archaeon]|nr:hypothetical protein [Candidatus Woesearchaeota archaeon]